MLPSEVAAAVENVLATYPGATLRRPATARGYSPVVLLTPGGRAPAIFIAPGLSGHIGELSEFGRLLRTRHAVYALQAPWFADAEPPDRIEEIAQYFCGAIEAAEPAGPYVLIGYSLGGLIMLEVARLLRQHSREVRFLALLDTYPHPRFWPMAAWLSFLAQRALQSGAAAVRLPPRQMIRRLAELVGDFAEQLAFRAGVDRRPRDLGAARVSEPLRSMRASLVAAEARYRPRRYGGEITFFRADKPEATPRDPTTIWGGVADRVEVLTIQGGHTSMLTEALAARVSDRVERALGEKR
jgi:thioesterase domain-containing protein